MILRRGTFLLLVLAYVAVLAYGAAVAPEQMPLHWGADGTADRVGTTGRWLVEASIVGAALLLVAFGLGLLADRLPGSLLNIPHKEIWTRPGNIEKARELNRDFGFDVFGDVFLLLVVIQGVAVVRADRGELTFPTWLFVTLLVVFLASVAFRVVLFRRAFSVPPAPPARRQGSGRR